MSVAWIQQLYNDTQLTFWLRSIDSANNGNIGGTELDGGDWHGFPGPQQYAANWCGIPWEYHGQHYKDLSSNRESHILRFWTLEYTIKFADGISGQPVGSIYIPGYSVNADVDFALSIRVGGVYFETLDGKIFDCFVIDSDGTQRLVNQDQLANVLGNVAGGTVPLNQGKKARHHAGSSGHEHEAAREDATAGTD